MGWFLRISMVAVLAVLPALARADEAVFADGRLWTLQGGQIVSLAEGEHQARRESLEGPAISLCRQNGHLVALARALGEGDALRIHKWEGEKWTAKDTLPGTGKGLVAMLCIGNDIVVVTENELITINDAGMRKVALRGEFGHGRQTFFGTDEAIYIGYDMGEWGGGLQAIRRSDGQVRTIERNESGRLCGGPLNTECDPVNGIAVLPWKPECVAAAVGLLHLDSSGRIVTICGATVEMLYARQFGARYANRDLPEADAYETIAFFGVVGSGDQLVALGTDGLHILSENGQTEVLTIPELPLTDGLRVSFEVPGVVLIGGARNRDDVYFASDIIMVSR